MAGALRGDDAWPFVDLFILLLLVFVILPHQPEASENEPPPGSVMVEIQWPYERNVDVDLWVQAPGDTPVGYSNLGSTYFNLLRDDLGHQADPSPVNFEVSYSRGRPAGEYVASIHYYRSLNTGPVPVDWRVLVTIANTRKPIVIQTGQTILERQGQEVMLHRFTLDEEGNVTGTSLIPRRLRGSGP